VIVTALVFDGHSTVTPAANMPAATD